MGRRASATANPLSGRGVTAGSSSVAGPSAAAFGGTAATLPVDPDGPPATGACTTLATLAETRVARLSWTGRRALLVAHDILAWAAGLTLAAVLRQDFDVSAVDLYSLAPLIAVAVLAQVVVGGVREAYSGRHSAGSLDDAANVSVAVLIAGMLAFLVNLDGSPTLVPRSVPLLALPIVLVTVVGARLTYRLQRERPRAARRRGPAQRVIIYGAGDPGQQVLRTMLADQAGGYRPVAFLDDDPGISRRRVLGVAVRGTRADIALVSWTTRADLLVIAGLPLHAPATREVSAAAAAAGLQVRVVPPLNDILVAPVSEDAVAPAEVPAPIGPGTAVLQSGAKRVLDVGLCLLALPVALPLGLVIALAVAFSGSDELIYRARRVGRNGRVFAMYKFSGMARAADGPRITRAGDPRITRVGRFLRASKLDELPQIGNVLKGDMSIVGPRPEAPYAIPYFTPEQRRVLLVRPGMTSLSFLRFGHEQSYIAQVGPRDLESYYITQLLPEKLDVELQYIRNWSLGLDLKIIFRTILGLFR
jgi:lipopolysaccharide/colanic/teichoic acid biosynthesis glycosyltransferase